MPPRAVERAARVEVLDSLLSARWNRWRHLVGDVLSAGFCAFISFYVWRYFFEAWEGGWVTDSIWAPRLWRSATSPMRQL